MKKNTAYVGFCILGILLLTHYTSMSESPRKTENFNKNWKFNLGDVSSAEIPGFNDSAWRILNVPHDWSIEGEFSIDNPATPDGGALPGGIGWYRKSFKMTTKDIDKMVFVEFDGVYMNSEVWINGHSLGSRYYGYSSFRYDLTPYLNYGDTDNVLAVKVDNSQQPNSRWYSGSGIYRNVRLVTTDKVCIDHWGTYVTTPQITNNEATVSLSTRLKNYNAQPKSAELRTQIFDPSGNKVTQSFSLLSIGKETIVNVIQNMNVKIPQCWNIDNPKLYKAVSDVYVDGMLVDRYETTFGIRSFDFDAVKGFLLNGMHIKINGVCNHHDLGCLGAAINTHALERQLKLLKEMGCNAIRTSHNPPAPELLDLCDSMGFIVMDEAFDMWKKGKNEFDYHLIWDKEHVRDLEDMILRDRNHPSVFIWSIGNEIPEQEDSTGTSISRELAETIRNLDNSRPITSALNNPVPGNYIIKSNALDLIGYNYHHQWFDAFPDSFPGKKFIASESVSALMTRGVYNQPSDVIHRWPLAEKDNGVKPNSDNTCSSYDHISTPWGSTHEETWKIIKKHDYLSGQFIWTGFDYLGEPTPYGWPSRSSYFGIIDLAGFPKDVYYMYQSEWTNKDVLHIFPHWNWSVGDTIDVWAYSNAEEVELFLNGKSLGTKQKQGDDLHLMWRVPYLPGILKAISRKGGKEIKTQEIKTADAANKLILMFDRSSIKADGYDLAFITVEVVDVNGTLVPGASNNVKFELEGNAAIIGVDNGDPLSHESFKTLQRNAFHGKCLAVVQSGETSGKITIRAKAEGLSSGEITILSN